MIDDPKGFVQSVSDADWAVLGASEPKLQSLTELKKQSYPSPVLETTKTKTATSKSPFKTTKKRRIDSEDEVDSEYDDEYGDEYDEEVAQESDDEGEVDTSAAGIAPKYGFESE